MAETYTHVAWIHATNHREANARIDTILDYAYNTWGIGTSTKARDRLTTLLDDNTLAVSNSGSMLIAVTRLDDAERDGSNPRAYAREQFADPATKHLIVPSMANMDSEYVTDALRHGVDVHTPDTGVVFRGDGGEPEPAVQQAVRTLCGDARDADTLIEGIPHKGGRPPIGTRVEHGYLRAADDYRDVCIVLQDVRDGRTAKTDAASKLGCARKTIDNALNRELLYQLD